MRADEVDAALDRERRAGGAGGIEADQRKAFDRVHPDGRADRLEQAGHQVDLNVEVAERAHEVDEKIVAVVGECDDDPLGVVAADERDDLVGRPQQRDLREIGSHRLRLRVDEPDELDAELGVLHDLAPDELTDIAGAHDDRVLDVARVTPDRGAGYRAAAEHEPERDPPKDECLVDGDVYGADHRGDGKAEPRPDRDERERGPGVVECRVVRPPLVAVVEAGGTRPEHPDGNEDRKDEHVAERSRPTVVEVVGDQEGDRERDHVGRHEGSTDQPPS